MTPLFERFVAEARELLETAGNGLLSLERNPQDADGINAVFRAVHTLKGSAGLFDIPAFVRLVHAGEDLLGAVREGRLVLTSSHCDVLFQVFDHATAWIDAMESTEALPPDAHDISRRLSEHMRALLPGAEPGPIPAAAAALAVEARPAPDIVVPAWLIQVPEADRLAAWRRLSATGDALVVGTYRPDAQCFFSGEDPLLTLRQLPGLLGFEIEPPPCWPAAEDFDPYACLLGFHFVSAAPRAEIEHLFRYIPDQVTLDDAPAEILAVPAGPRSLGPVHQDFADSVRPLLAAGDLIAVGRSVSALLEVSSPQSREASALRWMQTLLAVPQPSRSWLAALVDSLLDGGVPRPLMAPVDLAAPATEAGSAAPLGDTARALLAAQQRMISLPCAEGEWDGRLGAAGRVATAVLRASGQAAAAAAIGEAVAQCRAETSAQPLFVALGRLVDASNAPPGDLAKPHDETVRSVDFRSDDRTATRVLKVDQAKVDLLMTLIGELVVAKNSLPFLARRAEEVFGSREMSREIKDQHAIVDRIAQEMQGAIMQVRMLPVSQLFQRFPRLVRDLSRKLGKQIDLDLVGEDTEADKDVIESLGDPLLHIVRNSIDHGIELPDDRLAAGKPASATIRLRAYQEADAVLIEVSDDGRGIDADRVRQKALEKGLIDAERAASLSDDEAVQLVFLPGFSTATEVTDLSGRGVGMDVVRSTVHKAGGQVRLQSRRGEGTLVVLRLPLSMAVTRVLVVESDNRLFGVPMDLVAETVRVPGHQIRRFKQSETFVLRDQVIPLLRLRCLLHLPACQQHTDEEAVLVVRVAGGTVGIVIDRFKERMDIILKPFSGVLAGIPGYSGTALLGDGQVLPVLDLKELV